MASIKLPTSPFNGQKFIDSRSIEWTYDSSTKTWRSGASIRDIPLASETEQGLLTPQLKTLLDGLPKRGGGFGIITKPLLSIVPLRREVAFRGSIKSAKLNESGSEIVVESSEFKNNQFIGKAIFFTSGILKAKAYMLYSNNQDTIYLAGSDASQAKRGDKFEIIDPLYLNRDGAIIGDIKFTSYSLDISCIDRDGKTIEGYCPVPGDQNDLSGIDIKVSDKFLNEFCISIPGQMGPQGDRGLKGEKGEDGTGDGPIGLPGDSGVAASTTPSTVTGIKVYDSNEIYDTAVIGLELDQNAGKLYVLKGKVRTPNNDRPAQQVIATAVSRDIQFTDTEYSYEIISPSADSLSDKDVNLLFYPKHVFDENNQLKTPETEVISAKLSSVVDSMILHMQEKLQKASDDWDQKIKPFIESKDENARKELYDLANSVSECEWGLGMEFCVGVDNKNDCNAPPQPKDETTNNYPNIPGIPGYDEQTPLEDSKLKDPSLSPPPPPLGPPIPPPPPHIPPIGPPEGDPPTGTPEPSDPDPNQQILDNFANFRKNKGGAATSGGGGGSANNNEIIVGIDDPPFSDLKLLPQYPEADTGGTPQITPQVLNPYNPTSTPVKTSPWKTGNFAYIKNQDGGLSFQKNSALIFQVDPDNSGVRTDASIWSTTFLAEIYYLDGSFEQHTFPTPDEISLYGSLFGWDKEMFRDALRFYNRKHIIELTKDVDKIKIVLPSQIGTKSYGELNIKAVLATKKQPTPVNLIDSNGNIINSVGGGGETDFYIGESKLTPVITSVSSTDCSSATVIINGSGFSTAANVAPTVEFNGISGVVNSFTATSITVTIPTDNAVQGAATVDVEITNSDGGSIMSLALLECGKLIIDDVNYITPFSMAGGTIIEAAGSFNASTSTPTAFLVTSGGDVACTVTVSSSSAIRFTTPTLPVGLLNEYLGIKIIKGSEEVTVAGVVHAYAASPTITGISPTTAATGGGTTVIISGTGFTTYASPATPAVTIDGSSATVVSATSTSIQITTPPRPVGHVSNITVTNADLNLSVSAVQNLTIV